MMKTTIVAWSALASVAFSFIICLVSGSKSGSIFVCSQFQQFVILLLFSPVIEFSIP